jgi:hypothetical protein
MVYVSAFVIGLAVLGTAPDENPEVGSLHEANTRHENDMAVLREQNSALLGVVGEIKGDYETVRSELYTLTAQAAQFAVVTARLNATLRNRAWELAAELRNIVNRVNVPEVILDIPELPADAPPGSRGPYAMWRIHRRAYLTSQRNIDVDRQRQEIYTREYAGRVAALKGELQQAGISLSEPSRGAFFWYYVVEVANGLATTAEMIS